MHLVILVIEGLADAPQEELDGITPLDAAATPAMDRLAKTGRLGRAQLVPNGWPVTDDVALASILGINPLETRPGPGTCELAGAGMDIPDGATMRLDAVTVADDCLIDGRAGGIRSVETQVLMEAVTRALEAQHPEIAQQVELIPTSSHRGVLVDRKGDLDWRNLETQPPGQSIGATASTSQPRGEDAHVVQTVMACAADVLPKHEVNLVRRDLDEFPATALWAWGPGRSMPVACRMTGALISDHPLAGGLARLAGWADHRLDCGLTPAPAAAFAASVEPALAEHDTVVVWCRTVEAASHAGDLAEKIAAIEAVDRDLVGPVAQRLADQSEWRLLILPGHPTLLFSHGHGVGPAPFLLAGTRVDAVVREPYTEFAAAEADLVIQRGWELLEYVRFGSGMRMQNDPRSP